MESNRGYIGCKIIGKGMQEEKMHNIFGIGYDSCGDNGAMA